MNKDKVKNKMKELYGGVDDYDIKHAYDEPSTLK